MKIFYKVLSLPFQISNLFIDFLYNTGLKRSFKVSVPVISVGNISFGGEGKTPLVISLSRFFLQKGLKTAILIRGYRGRKEVEGGIASNGDDWKEYGDEALLIAKNVPDAMVMVGKNRVSSASRAVEMGVSLLILDDGFQYRKLYRDMDIVILSPRASFKREFLYSISRADVVLINKDYENEEFIKNIRKKKGIPIFTFSVRNTGIFDMNGNKVDLKDKRVIAFCGIANPDRFLKSLHSIPLKPEKIIFFPDHYEYTFKDVKKIEEEAKRRGAEFAVTTEKDFIRLSGLPFSLQIVYSKIEGCPEREFYEFLVERLKL